MEQVPNVSDTEAQKQVMSPIVDHFVALQADFQKQLAALRELTDNWRHEKDPPNKLGNNKSDNLYDRSDKPTVLIDANLVPRAVQQAPDVAEPSDLAITRQEQATIDSRDDSKYSLNATKPTEGLDQVDAALPTEILTTTVDDLAKTSAMDTSRAPEYSSKIDNTDYLTGESSAIDTDKTVVRNIESDRLKYDGQKSESDDVEVKQTARSHEKTKEMRADTSTTSIDETAMATEVTNSLEEQERLSPDNAGVEVFSSHGTSALDVTNNTEPGQSSSMRQETSSGPELPSDVGRRSTATGNSESLVEVGKSAELSGALSFQNSSVPQRANILPRRSSSRDESSVANTANVTEKIHADERDLSAREQSDQRVISSSQDEPHVVEALLSAVKSLPEQFLTPFITAMQMLSPEKGVNVTSDVQLMNRLNTLHNMKTDDPKTKVEINDNKANIGALRNSATTVVAPRNADADEETSVSMLENKTQSLRKKAEEGEDKHPPGKSPEKLRSSKIIDKDIDRAEFPDSRRAKSRSSVPDIKQQHQDVRSVRTDTNESNISQINVATDLTSDSVDLMDKDNPEESQTMTEVATSSAGVAEVLQTDVTGEIYSRKDSLEIVGTATNNNQEKSIEDETVPKERSAEEMHSSGESPSSHVQLLTASSTHDQSIVQKPVELTLASGDGSTDTSSSSKEAKSSSEKASHEKLLADNAFTDIDPLLKTDSSQDKSSVACVNDSNTGKSASQSMTETHVSQKDPIVHNSNADHPPVSYEVIMNATNTQSANEQDINKRDETRQSNDSSHAHVSTSASPISSTSSLAKLLDYSLDVKSPPVEIFDNHGTTLHHDKNDTKPIVSKNAVHVSEKVEQTISVTYHTPASDDKNETTLKENVPVEQNTANDLSIIQSRTNKNILPPLTHSHVLREMNLSNLRDQGEEMTFISVKSDGSIEQTSDIPPLTDSHVINQDKFNPTSNQEIIAPSHNYITYAKIIPSFSKNNIEVNTRPENISQLEISNSFDGLETSKDIKISEDSKTVSIPETSKLTVGENFVTNINKLSDEGMLSQLHELSNSNDNTLANTCTPLSVEHVPPSESRKNILHPVGRDEEPYLEDKVSQSHDDKKQDAQTSNSTTRNILHALKNFNIFFTTSTEGRNIASTVNKDPLPDPIIANVSDVTPGIPDTFEIKISESPVTTVNDCAPIKNIVNIVEREMDQIEGVDTIGEETKDSGNEIPIVTHDEQVEPAKLPNNESPIERNTGVNQFRKSVIAKPIVKHRSRSPLKKIVRRKSPVKMIKKSASVSKRNFARKGANPYSTTVAKAKATASEIVKKSNRAMQSDESRIKPPLKSTCVASDKTGSNNKSIVDDKIAIKMEKDNLKSKTLLPSEVLDKTAKQSLNINVQRTTGNIKVNDNKKVPTSGTEKISIVNNATNPEPQTKLPVVKKYNGNKSENSKKSTLEYSKNKNIEDVRNKNPGGSKSVKAEAFENQTTKKINHKTEISNNDKILMKKKKDNLKPKTSLPSKIPILMQRKITRSTNVALSNPSKTNLNDTSLLKGGSTKLPVKSQTVSKLSLKIQERANILNPPTVRKIDSEDTNKLMRNQIKSSNGRAIEITENAKDKQILEENHAKESTVESEETEEPPKVKSIESKLNGNLQASNSKHNDPSADLGKQLEVENAIEESSDAFSSDSEYSEEDEDTGTAKYVSDHNSEYNSVEEFTDAELLLEKTLNEIRSEISESEEERTSESEESEDVTYSYETESYDHNSASSEGSVDEREIESSEFGDSEDMYEELPSEGEATNEQVETSERSKVPDKEIDGMIHNETSDNERNISNRTENDSQVTQEDEEINLKTSTEAAIVELSRSEVNEEILKISQSLKTDSNIATTDSAAASSTTIGQSVKSKEDIQLKKNDLKKNETRLEDASEAEKRDQSIVQNDTLKTLKITSHESREKRAKVGRRASTGSKEIKIENDDTLKGMDRARAPKKRFSLVASCIRRFEGEENAERESIRRKRQGSPKTEREVSRRELPSDTRPPS